ncbi:MAG TPA: hypothetical protein GXX29_04915 [Firmicutes bacterium]|nr:hypothetical protein [Bacillota bacterium]
MLTITTLMMAACPAAASALEPITAVEIGPNNEFRVNGQPFLPIMLWLQGEARIPDGLSIGINTFTGNGGNSSNLNYLKALAANGLYGIIEFDQNAVGHSHLLGWIHHDEPDLPAQRMFGRPRPRTSVEEVAAYYQRIKQVDPSRPVLVTFTAHFMKELTNNYEPEQKAQIYPPMVKYADVVGFDYYPIFGWNRPETLDYVAEGVTQLKEIAGKGKPIYAWIETNKGTRVIAPEKQLPVTPQDTRAEVWMALIRGATAIGYFTHSWVPEPYTQFAPDAEMRAALKELNERITRLAPAILADPASEVVSMKMESDLACHFKQTKLNGELWIFAQNIDMGRRSGKATFSIPSLPAGTIIEVVDESRTIIAEEGEFSDDFPALAEHVYRIRKNP